MDQRLCMVMNRQELMNCMDVPTRTQKVLFFYAGAKIQRYTRYMYTNVFEIPYIPRFFK